MIKDSPGMRTSSMRILGSYAIAYVVRGNGSYSDANGLQRPIEAGQMILVFPDVPHVYVPALGKTWDEIYITFDGPVFDLWRERGILSPIKPILDLQPIEYWFSRIYSCIPHAAEDEVEAALERICAVQKLLAEALAHDARRQLGGEDRQWLARAQSLLEASSNEPEDLEDVAAQLGMSYANFRKRFAKLAHIAPAKYRFNHLIQHSAEMMRDPALTLRDIADRCSFCNEFHFSRRFKQTMGLSPSEYRRRLSISPSERGQE